MKKVSLTLKPLFFLSIIIILCLNSCDDKEENLVKENEKSNTSQSNIFKKFSENELIEFKNDENVHFLSQSYHEFILQVRDNNYQGMSNTSKKGREYLEKLFLKYGKENVLDYIEELSLLDSNSGTDPEILKALGSGAIGEHDGSSCTRNLNGTTYWGNCSFWEGVQAYAGILLNCGSINIPGSTSQEIEDYAICNQSQICKNC